MTPNQRRSIGALVLAGLSVWLVDEAASALEVSTHRIVNGQAALASESLEAFLRDGLGFPVGLNTRLSRGSELRNVREWLQEGGDREDDWFRSLRHFHDPLQPWDAAGLALGSARFESSARWMQRQDGITAGGPWSWGDARRLYYDALTEPDPVRREALWADLFRGLGQIMHLVVDASVPEHARNDAHLSGALKLGQSYERWVTGQHGPRGRSGEASFIARYLAAPIGFAPEILQLAPPEGEGVAKVPVARLIDADRYNGTNPGITVGGTDPRAPVSAGLAEIANANFFSESTLRRQYPSPTDEGLVPINLATPLGRVRRYLSRPPGQGLLPANPLRAECAAEAYHQGVGIVPLPPYPCTDALVWDQVAAQMLPRAVGYARGVLDYFFRGTLRVDRVFWQGGGSAGVYIEIANVADEEMDGTFAMYARHGRDADERRELSGAVAGGERVQIGPGETATLPLTLEEGGGASGAQLLVFRGRLGLEQEAVAAQIFDVRHLVIAQTTATAVMRGTCDVFESSASEKGSFCEWRASSHDVEGQLLADATAPVIARVSAAWEFATGRKSADLEIDGVPIPGGVWDRQGSEPDPRRFQIIAGVNQGNRLVVRVQLVSGETVATPMAVLASASASSKTHYTNPRSHLEAGPWYVAAERAATTTVLIHPPHRILSIGGHPNPTEVRLDRFSINSLKEYLTVYDTAFNQGLYRQFWVDAADVFTTPPPGGPIALRPTLKAKFNAMPVSPLPVVLMEAEVERVYEPAELEFLKTFVTSVPPPHTFTTVGRLSGT